MISSKQVAVLVRRSQVVAQSNAPVARMALGESVAEIEAVDPALRAQGEAIRSAAPGTPIDDIGLVVPEIDPMVATAHGGYFVATWDTGSGLLMFLRPGFTGLGFEIGRAWRFARAEEAEEAAAKVKGRVMDADAVERVAFRACEAHRVLG